MKKVLVIGLIALGAYAFAPTEAMARPFVSVRVGFGVPAPFVVCPAPVRFYHPHVWARPYVWARPFPHRVFVRREFRRW